MNTINCVAVFVAMLTALLCIEIAAQTSAPRYPGSKDSTGSGTRDIPELYPISDPVEALLVKQVSNELSASMEYLAMASYFGQDNVALMGFKKFFMDNSDEEKEHAKKLVDYLNERDGKLTGIDIKPHSTLQFNNGLEALKHALKMEEKVSVQLMQLHHVAQNNKDVHLVDALENDMLREQVEATRRLKGLITRLERISDMHNAKLAEYFFDKELQEKS